MTTHNVIPSGQLVSGRNPTKEPYSFQAFPTTRYHPDGRHQLVANEDALNDLDPEWRDTPYPPRPQKHTADATEAVVSLADDHEKLSAAYGNLKASQDALLNDKATLQLELIQVQGELKEALMANGNLQRQLTMVRGQLTAAKKKEPVVAVDPAAAHGAPPLPTPTAGEPHPISAPKPVTEPEGKKD